VKKTLLSLAVLAAALAGTVSAQAADKLTLELKWVTQAQFAGYYVAKAKGYYKDADLDVTINPSGTDVTPVQALAAGGADVIIDWLADALSAREKGVQIVNIAQPYKDSGLWMTCRKDMGVTSTADFKGKTLGVWFGGNEYPFYAWMAKLNYPTNGGADGVTVLKQGFDVNPLLQKQAACVSTMSYNEYGQVLDGGLKPDQLTVFNYRDEGVGMLEDGLYVMQDRLQDPKFQDEMVRFVTASMKGWHYAVAHPDEAAQIVVDADDSGAATLHHQEFMMAGVAKLIDPGTGALDDAAYKESVATLLSAAKGDANPAITKAPDAGAVTHAITDKVTAASVQP
jgi:NitT/TauT family transport system substrate-binding protein